MNKKKFKLLIHALLFMSLSAFAWSGFAAADTPKFQDYPIKVYSGPVHAPDLSSHPEARTYRTRLKNAAKAKVNFAGEFILTSWGCGTTCIMGAALNAKTGEVIFLPSTVCCWGDVDDNFSPIETRSDSRLIILSGLRNEEDPNGAHYYELRDGEFQFVRTVIPRSAPVQNWSCRNTAAEISCNTGACEVAKAHTPMDVSVSLSGKMNICAYTGCWEGMASSVLTSGRYLTLSSSELIWSKGSTKTGVEGTVTIDTTGKTATIMIENFAHPLSCNKID